MMPTPHYEHFAIEQLDDGVYAAIATDAGGLLCNAGIVDLGGATLVLDTGATLAAARELRSAAEALTGRPPTYVVNSHVHPDHVNGNVVFSEATLIASDATRAAIAATGLAWMESMRLQFNGKFPSYPHPADLRIPPVSYKDELTLHGTQRTARLIACGTAHSECDAVLWLPEPGILFTGDLITDGNLILCYGNPRAWLGVLDRLAALAPRVVVPGHGLVAPAGAAITRARAYISELLDQAAQALATGQGAAWLASLPVPEPYSEEYWLQENVRFLLGQS